MTREDVIALLEGKEELLFNRIEGVIQSSSRNTEQVFSEAFHKVEKDLLKRDAHYTERIGGIERTNDEMMRNYEKMGSKVSKIFEFIDNYRLVDLPQLHIVKKDVEEIKLSRIEQRRIIEKSDDDAQKRIVKLEGRSNQLTGGIIFITILTGVLKLMESFG